jgi:hypothetical protein
VKLGISEAGRRAGVNRKVLYRLMEKGQLSKEILDGKPVIDLSELARLFPAAIAEPGQPVVPGDKIGGADGQLLLDGLRGQISVLQAENADLRAVRDKLLAMVGQQAETVRLLTDQRQPRRRRFWFWLPPKQEG